ncbi:MAG: hypothetical protein HOH95_13755 [Dehalococcoidia bacterium]|jgi:hypothetical protein|nr:hypothetical protein [Dehalococcoidia bacterium]
MAFHAPPPQPDHDRAKANLVIADEHRRQRVGGFQDIAIVLGWLRRAIAWPTRLVLRVVRRKHSDDMPRFD